MRQLMWALAGAAWFLAGAAHGHPIRAVYGGALYHDVPLISSDSGSIEQGPNLQGEIQFESPRFFRHIGDPAVFVMGSVNVRGDTSFGGFGLTWSPHIAKRWTIDPGIGYIVHSGALDIPFPAGDPRNTAFSDANILFGSRDLFRLSLGISRQFGDRWSGQLFYEHLSHGQIIGDGRNQGLDSIGLRIGYHFRDRRGEKIGKK